MVRLIASLVSKKINKWTKKQTNMQHFYWQGLVANFPRVIILDQIRSYKLIIMTYDRWKFYPSSKISYFFYKLINDALKPFDSTNVDIYVLWHREHTSFFVLVSRNITQVGVKFHCDQILNSNNLSKYYNRNAATNGKGSLEKNIGKGCTKGQGWLLLYHSIRRNNIPLFLQLHTSCHKRVLAHIILASGREIQVG